MRLVSWLLPATAAAAGFQGSQQTQLDDSPQYFFANPSSSSQSAYRIPTSQESAVLARRILALTPLGTLATVFPATSRAASSEDEDGSTLERRPPGLAGVPISLMDYIADCEGTGDPTILAIQIAPSFKNVAAGSNISLSLRWTPPYKPDHRIESLPSQPLRSLLRWLGLAPKKDERLSEKPDAVPYSAANLPRFSLTGYLERIPLPSAEGKGAQAEGASVVDRPDADIAACFVATHPDARYWLPGNRIHASEWVRLVVTQVYWIGGFGDRAYIGWIPIEQWRNVTRDDWEAVRLPGEKKGWDEWAQQDDL